MNRSFCNTFHFSSFEMLSITDTPLGTEDRNSDFIFYWTKHFLFTILSCSLDCAEGTLSLSEICLLLWPKVKVHDPFSLLHFLFKIFNWLLRWSLKILNQCLRVIGGKFLINLNYLSHVQKDYYYSNSGCRWYYYDILERSK